jgi:hypothetical protein
MPSTGLLADIAGQLHLAVDREGSHPSRAFLTAFATSQVMEPDPHVASVLRLGVRGLGVATGITQSLGLHLWLLIDRDGELRMRRYARQRLADNARPNNWGDFRPGEGVVGAAWQANRAVELDLLKHPYGTTSTAADWRKLPRTERLGMSWTDMQRTKTDFGAVIATPITDNAPTVVGVVSANAGRSERRATELLSPRARNWLEEVASVAWDAIPPGLREQIESLPRIP